MPNIQEFNGSSFRGAARLIKFNYDETRNASIVPASVTKLYASGNRYIFQNTAIENLIIEANVAAMPNSMFSSMTKLETVVFTRAYTFPNNNIFNNCANLEGIAFLEVPAGIRANTFQYLTGTPAVLDRLVITVPNGSTAAFTGLANWPSALTAKLTEAPAEA